MRIFLTNLGKKTCSEKGINNSYLNISLVFLANLFAKIHVNNVHQA